MRLNMFVLRILGARWAVLASALCLSVAAAATYGFLGAESYPATATVFMEPGPFDTGSGAGPGARASGLDLLRSERVAQRVVENERLVEDPALRGQYLESIDAGRPPVEAIAQYVAEHVEASAAGEGGVVRVTASLSDPAVSARVANAYAQAWGEVSLELRATAIRDGVQRAGQDLAALRARLGEARARRSDGGALAAAGSRADEQFAQLSRLEPGAPLSPAPAADGPRNADWARGLTVADDAAAVARLNPSGDASSGAEAAARPLRVTHLDGADAPRGGSSTTVDDEIRLAQQSLERAEDRLTRLAAEGIGAPFPAHLLRAARPATVSSKPGVGACAALGAAIGLALGLIGVCLAEAMDRRVRRPSDLARGLGIVVLGDLPAVVPGGSGIDGPAPRRWLPLQRA
jgi:uncharacterized protein involved in exopolysaccharide biosynthesis